MWTSLPVVRLWPESPPVPADQLDAETARLRSYLKQATALH
ncbi:hypothetical protein GA0070624_1550 [Micromonospora rhizosphaerae]|uniref:Uncharacterized protein n=1 Tax=Micromonospora rhizosphaerae TaxID=568872 RepID=A0A1C6RMW9_9ACTN|nr:hypothetical protein [Micromonospora rhizosphaerae]SCL18530.1 hypothetical protein GA0070624_1550 [Micromonospora rhizosphaerae]